MTEKLHYSELTPFQQKSVCNGCGGKGGIFNPPEFLFHASCNQHDFYYWRGGDESDRKEADDTYYDKMKEDVAEASAIKRPFYGCMAWIYYKAVRIVGKKFFNYTDTPMTLEDALKISEDVKVKIREEKKQA